MNYLRPAVIGLLALAALSLSSAAPAATAIPTPTPTPTPSASPAGPVAAYGFNEGSGTTVANASGNGNTGAISGATRTASGRFGGALTFDGVDDWVTVADANSLDLSTAMTLEAWVNPEALAGWQTAIFKEQAGWHVYALYADTDPLDGPSGEITTATAYFDNRGPTKVPVNIWSHLAATYDGSVLRLYVDGVEVKSRAVSGAIIVASSGPLRFGGNSVWGEWFKGRIDEVRIYDRALTASEIAEDMNTPITDSAPPTPPVVLF